MMRNLRIAGVFLLAATSGCLQSSDGQPNEPIDEGAAKTVLRLEHEDELVFGNKSGKICTPVSSPETGSILRGFASIEREENDTWHQWSMDWAAENPTLATLGFAIWPQGQRDEPPVLFVQGTSPMVWNITSQHLQNFPNRYDLVVMPPDCGDAGVVAVAAISQTVHVRIAIHALDSA